MRLTHAVRDAVHFAQLCQQPGITPMKLAALVMCVRKRERMYVRWNNGTATSEQDSKAMEAVEAAARNLGLTTDWPGIFPMFQDKDGTAIHVLPCIG